MDQRLLKTMLDVTDAGWRRARMTWLRKGGTVPAGLLLLAVLQNTGG